MRRRPRRAQEPAHVRRATQAVRPARNPDGVRQARHYALAESIFGAAAIEQAFAARVRIRELPTSTWRRVLTALDDVSELPRTEKRAFLLNQPEPIRVLIILLLLDHDATIPFMRAKLGAP